MYLDVGTVDEVLVLAADVNLPRDDDLVVLLVAEGRPGIGGARGSFGVTHFTCGPMQLGTALLKPPLTSTSTWRPPAPGLEHPPRRLLPLKGDEAEILPLVLYLVERLLHLQCHRINSRHQKQ